MYRISNKTLSNACRNVIQEVYLCFQRGVLKTALFFRDLSTCFLNISFFFLTMYIV